jgi:hypothetical protein
LLRIVKHGTRPKVCDCCSRFHFIMKLEPFLFHTESVVAPSQQVIISL